MTTSLQKIKDKAEKKFHKQIGTKEDCIKLGKAGILLYERGIKLLLDNISLAYHQGQEEERKRILANLPKPAEQNNSNFHIRKAWQIGFQQAVDIIINLLSKVRQRKLGIL